MPKNPIAFDFTPFISVGAELFFLFLVATFTIFSLVLGYHTFSYSLNKRLAATRLVVFLLVGLVIILGLALTLRTL